MTDATSEATVPAAAPSARSVLVVTGMAGAGRSTVSNALEDLGWYVVDNLPPQMLRPLLDLAGHSDERLSRIAVVVDVRGGQLLSELKDAAEASGDGDGPQLRLLFLEANDAALVRRFEAVRRPHPLQGGGTILDGITAERAMTADVREQSDIIIDTSELNIHQLATAINELFSDDETPGVRVTITSFGFKYGVPTDADMVADARFLPNPFWVPELRSHTGKGRRRPRLRARAAGGARVHRAVRGRASPGPRRLPAGEQEPRDHRDRLHRRQAPLGGRGGADGRPHRVAAGRRGEREAPGSRARVARKCACRCC